jgi:hypothetical protein
MKLEYTLDADDFLDFQLFTASKSEGIKKKQKRSWRLLTIWAIIVTVYFVVNKDYFLSFYFALVSIVFGMLYPKYFRWKYKKYYKKFIRANYAQRFGKPETLEFKKDSLFSKDIIGEGEVKLSEVVQLDETGNHFFIMMNNGSSFIIPKNKIGNIERLKEEFESRGLTVHNDLNWSWK